MPDFPGQGRRRNSEYRALGMSHAVTAYLAGDRPGQRAATASAHDQQITRAAGKADQNPAGRAPLDVRLHHRIVWDFSPDGGERIPEPLAGGGVPDLAQIARELRPGGMIALRRHPGKNGNEGRLVGAGQALRVAQRPETAR